MRRECRTIEGLLSTHLDGELTGDQERRCAAHLAECADCQRELERLSAARSLLCAMPPPEAPPHLAALIKSSLTASRRPAAVVAWPAWATPVAAAAALVLALSVGLFRGPGAPAPDSHVASVPAPVEVVEPLVSDDAALEVVVALDEPSGEVAVASLVHAAERRAAPRRAGFVTRAAVIAEAAEVIMAPAAIVEDEPGFAFGAAVPEDRSIEVALVGTAASPVGEELAVAFAPRLSPVEGNIGAPVAPVTAAAPSDLELELAGGVVASLLVDEFIAEHIIESAPTMLSVVTATPSAELGLMMVEGEDEARFELCFTESMRRALAGVGE